MNSIYHNLIMEMRTCASACIAYSSNFISPFNTLAKMDICFRKMAVFSNYSITMIYKHHPSQSVIPVNLAHNAVCSCKYRGADSICNIKAFVHLPQAGKWRYTVTKRG